MISTPKFSFNMWRKFSDIFCYAEFLKGNYINSVHSHNVRPSKVIESSNIYYMKIYIILFHILQEVLCN